MSLLGGSSDRGWAICTRSMQGRWRWPAASPFLVYPGDRVTQSTGDRCGLSLYVLLTNLAISPGSPRHTSVPSRLFGDTGGGMETGGWRERHRAERRGGGRGWCICGCPEPRRSKRGSASAGTRVPGYPMTKIEKVGMVARVDGREANQLRPLATEQSLLNRADGSASFSQGATSVLAAVYGPAQPKMARKELIDRCAVEVVFKPQNGIAGACTISLPRS